MIAKLKNAWCTQRMNKKAYEIYLIIKDTKFEKSFFKNLTKEQRKYIKERKKNG